MTKIIQFIKKAEFRIKTIQEAHAVASFISQICPNPRLAIVGMTEVFFNAIEHGNLGITCSEKTQLQKKGNWLEEINKRLKSKEHRDKFVAIYFIQTETEISLKIVDQGNGFAWKRYQTQHESAYSTHGRGLDIAQKLVFSSMEYSGKGNIVTCVIPLKL